MTIIPLAITYCSVVELLLQVFALVNGSYGDSYEDNTTSSGVSNYGAPIIYNWKQASDTAI